MTRLVLQSGAEEDLDAASQWYRRQSGALVDHLLREVGEALDRISDSPHVGAVAQDVGAVVEVRRLPLRRFPYLVFSTVEQDILRVVAITHTSRIPGWWMDRLPDGKR